jgi:Asp-tRNA(Asn)/Glu-tRNA(Gln) amidotransferase A subunit family amidase
MAPIALGTQTMGSLIRPAAYCGVVAYKPSFGLIRRAGIKPQAESVDTVGVMSRNVDDAALVAAVLSGATPDSFDGLPLHPPRITVYRGPDWSKVEASTDEILAETARRLATAGAIVTVAGQPAVLREALVSHEKVVQYEIARTLMFEWLNHRDKLSSILQGQIEQGLSVSFEEYLAAQAKGAEARQWFAAAASTTDLWLSASATGEAPEGIGYTGDTTVNRLWSFLHVPVVTLPVGHGPRGLPLGCSLIGSCARDAEFICFARWAEQALKSEG